MTKQQVSETTGAALVARIRAEMAAEGLEPDGREIELLGLAESLADRVAELEAAITARLDVDIEGRAGSSAPRSGRGSADAVGVGAGAVGGPDERRRQGSRQTGCGASTLAQP